MYFQIFLIKIHLLRGHTEALPLSTQKVTFKIELNTNGHNHK